MRKSRTLKAGLPEPHLCLAGNGEQGHSRMGDGDEIELLVIGWGSTGDVMHRAISRSLPGVMRLRLAVAGQGSPMRGSAGRCSLN